MDVELMGTIAMANFDVVGRSLAMFGTLGMEEGRNRNA